MQRLAALFVVFCWGSLAYADGHAESYAERRAADADQTRAPTDDGLALETPGLVRSAAATAQPPNRIALLLGGGIANFTGTLAHEATKTGGAWEVTLIFGTHRHLAFEGSYNGSLNRIEAVGLTGNALLVGTSAQGAIHLNFTTGAIQPYVLAGIGWTHYALAGEATNVSGIRNDDNVVNVPLGGGVSARFGDFLIDGRATYKYAMSSNMFDTIADATGSSGKMTSWSARVAAGFEF